MEYDNKVMALAKLLKVKPSIIEENGNNYFVINKRTIKEGKSPEQIQKIADDFGSLLDEEKRSLVTNCILGIKNANEAYKEIEQYLEPLKARAKKRKEAVSRSQYPSKKTIEDVYNRLEEEHLYVVNVLYHLIHKDSYNEDYQNNLRRAWLGQPVNDIRKDAVVDDGEYIVLTDEEADDFETEYLESIFREMTHSIPDNLERYMDIDKFTCENSGNRGENISGYDGVELSQDYDGTTYYIYRSN